MVAHPQVVHGDELAVLADRHAAGNGVGGGAAVVVQLHLNGDAGGVLALAGDGAGDIGALGHGVNQRDGVVPDGDSDGVAGAQLVDGAGLVTAADLRGIGEVHLEGDHPAVGSGDADDLRGGAGGVADVGDGALGDAGAGIARQHGHLAAGQADCDEPVLLDVRSCGNLAVIGHDGVSGKIIGGGFVGLQIGNGHVVDAAGAAHALHRALNVLGDRVQCGGGHAAVVIGHPQGHIAAHVAGAHAGDRQAVGGDGSARGNGEPLQLAVKAGDGDHAAAGGLGLHGGNQALGLPGAAGELDGSQVVLLVHPADGGGVPGLGVDELIAAHLLPHLDLCEAVVGQGDGGAVDIEKELAVGHAHHSAGHSVQLAGQAHRHGGAVLVVAHPGVGAGLEQGAVHQHAVLIDGGVRRQGDGVRAGQVAVEGEENHILAVGGGGDNGARLPLVVGVVRQLHAGPPLLHEGDGPGEHGGGHLAGNGALGLELVLVGAGDDAVCIEQIDVGLAAGGDVGLIGKGEGIAGQVLGHGGQLHGPHQVQGKVLLGDGLAVVQRAGVVESLQLSVGEDARLQAGGVLIPEPGLLVAHNGGDIVSPVLADLGPQVALHGNAGAQRQGLAALELVLGAELAVVIAFKHALFGHVVDIGLRPVSGGHVGERGGECGYRGQ